MWLLERRFPAEFNPKKGTAGGGGTQEADLLGMAVEFVQRSSTNNPLIKETAGRAFVLKAGSGEEMVKNIRDVIK